MREHLLKDIVAALAVLAVILICAMIVHLVI
jgi:hypothetical protein